MRGWLALFVVGCDSAPPTEEAQPYTPVCDALVELPCAEGMSADLPVHDAVSSGTVSSSVVDNDWLVDVDATAGGFIDAPENPWLYVRFTDAGLEKVELTDLESFESADWHLAVHRFRMRLNGGSGGPSCVSAAAFEGAAYSDLSEADAEGAFFEVDAFYDDTCTFVAQEDDPEAPPGIPVTALSDWWTYPDCVATTSTPFLIRLASGRLLRFEVLRYYESGQDVCNTQGTPGAGAGNVQLKWAFVH